MLLAYLLLPTDHWRSNAIVMSTLLLVLTTMWVVATFRQPWPAAAHGLKLGKIVQEIRSTGGKYIRYNHHPERRS